MIAGSGDNTSLVLGRFAKFVEASPKCQPILLWTGMLFVQPCTLGIPLHEITEYRLSAMSVSSGGSGMKRTSRAMLLSFVGCLLGASLGCQTWVGGMTLPSPDYLKDKPDYIQPAPLYKHSKELASMQKAMAEANPNMNKYPAKPSTAPVGSTPPAPPAQPPVAPMNPMGQ